MRLPRTATIAIVSAAAIVALDQVVKWAIDRQIGPGAARSERWIAEDWLGLSYVRNTGVAFGILGGSSTIVLILAALATLVVIGAFVWLHRESSTVLIAGSFIIGGAIGNLIDRIWLGHVRDFFVVGPWPAFNIADSAISAGVVLAVYGIFRADFGGQRGENSRSPRRPTALDTTK